MRFIDEATITVQSGNGGRGCVSFRREKFIEKGGPDGGDGGDGGSVILKISAKQRTLYEFRHKKLIKAKNGGHGQGQQKHGKNGEDVFIELPPGTVVTDAETGELIHDFINNDDSVIIAKGGIGGRGNKRFATSRNRVPKFAQPGEPGQIQDIRLELKLIADVGIIGFPNAGKSTLISVLSSARPKTGNYPFTTLTPNIGMVQQEWGEPFAVADIPGLIEGAHTGIGLGTKFLRHVERTKFLVHLIDASEITPEDPVLKYNAINRELKLYSEKLAEKKQIVVLNKTDLPGTSESVELFRKAVPGVQVLEISAVTTKGVRRLKEELASTLNNFDE